MTRRVKGALRSAVYGGAVLVTIGGVYLATRNDDAPAAMAAEHAHGATPALADGPRSVSLTPEQQRRIGVTYAVATSMQLATEIRAVGQVAYDEARVKTISPKVDGFVEQLLVNATGQFVSRGQPLLTIYSPMLVQVQSLTFTAAAARRDVLDVSLTMAHMPPPGGLGKLLDLASIGVAALADLGKH